MKIKKLLFFILSLVFISAFFILRSPNYASTGSGLCNTLGGNSSGKVCDFIGGTAGVPANCSSINTLFGTVVTFLFSVAGLVFFVMLVISGIKIITAGGDKEKISSAQTAIMHAVIGIIVVAGAYLILELVTGVLGVQGSIFNTSPITSNCSLQ
jgi:hypothetical protein